MGPGTKWLFSYRIVIQMAVRLQDCYPNGSSITEVVYKWPFGLKPFNDQALFNYRNSPVF